jgi:hypothetical protein
MGKRITRILSVLISFVLILQLVGCGTIFYPERKGQISGRIDPTVAILDGIGLLFFIIPGVIAYAVDFNNGTIYLPGTSRSSLDIENIKQVKFDPADKSMANIERIIQRETGYDVALNRDRIQIFELRSTDDMMMHFAEVSPEIRDAGITLSMKQK